MKSVMRIAFFLILTFGINLAMSIHEKDNGKDEVGSFTLPKNMKNEPILKFLVDGRVTRDTKFPKCAHVNNS